MEVHPLRVSIRWRMGTTVAQTGFHLRAAGPAFPTLDAVVTEVSDFATVQFRKLLATTDELLGVDVFDMTSEEAAQSTWAATTGLYAAGNSAMPSFVTAPVSLKSKLRKRYGQGRMLWPVRGEGMTDNEILAPTAVTLFQGVIDDMIARYVDDDLTGTLILINVHGALAADRPHKKPEPLPAVPATWYDVGSIRLNKAVSSLRTRKQGIGS